jgi:hypothetical protein
MEGGRSQGFCRSSGSAASMFQWERQLQYAEESPLQINALLGLV